MSLVLLPVPHIKQRRRGECLAACARMVLAYQGQTTTYNRLLKVLRIKSERGTLAANVLRLETLNVHVVYRAGGTFADLLNNLEQDRPAIAFIDTGELSHWPVAVGHAVVVVGLDAQCIYVNDPAFTRAPLRIDRGEFDLAWLEWDEKYAVVTPRS